MESAGDKYERMLAGKQVVASDEDMTYFEAQPAALRLASRVNPDRVGILDAWVAWINPGEEA